MNEDQVVDAAIGWLGQQGWQVCYRTRPVAAGAIGGVDAILIQERPHHFAFVEGKGEAATPVQRSAGFTQALGSLLKRIRFERGYLGIEATERLQPTPGQSVAQLRALLQESAVHRRSEYFLALPHSYRQTVEVCLDPALAALLHMRVLLVAGEAGATELWYEPADAPSTSLHRPR